ncbi:hypothetical protein WH47_07258 [Habropoda laboriosa]|uniref:Uncharacterized protein n=1 Tax=Habropoda laboriosa TaxID=597456 RepID=A0A0L7R5U7_9HYME|nr:hypothetical protein WH47_07258 [Habropoda laboriosa]
MELFRPRGYGCLTSNGKFETRMILQGPVPAWRMPDEMPYADVCASTCIENVKDVENNNCEEFERDKMEILENVKDVENNNCEEFERDKMEILGPQESATDKEEQPKRGRVPHDHDDVDDDDEEEEQRGK